MLHATSMRLGIYGGTFDPVHHGHLILARDAAEGLGLDRVLLVPAAISPHKLGSRPAPASLRREMLEVAVAGDPMLAVDARELGRAGPSFTADTVEELAREHPGAELWLLLGQDHLPKLHTWHRIADLQRLARFAVFGRGAVDPAAAVPVVPRRIDLSGTEIRDRVARGACIRYLVPEAVRALIERHGLYASPHPPLPSTPNA